MKPSRERSRVVATYPVLTLREHLVRYESGVSQTVVTLDLPDWVIVVPTDADGNVWLVEQHRHGIDGRSLEPPGGVVDPGETPAEAGVRELREELGLEGDPPTALGWTYPNPALSGNRSYVVWVANCRKLPEGAAGGDEHESLTTVCMSPAEVRRALNEGRIAHALAVVALERWFYENA